MKTKPTPEPLQILAASTPGGSVTGRVLQGYLAARYVSQEAKDEMADALIHVLEIQQEMLKAAKNVLRTAMVPFPYQDELRAAVADAEKK